MRSDEDLNTLRVSWESFVGLDPTMETKTSLQVMVRTNLFDGLITRDATGKIQPSLAISWQMRDDLTYVFKLREGVRFHNGQPFDAEAVRNTFERLARSQFSFLTDQVSAVDVVDPYTVVLRTREPYAPLLANLTMVAMLPPGVGNLDEYPIGTGPYRFASYRRGEELTLEANQDYWQGSPAASQVIYIPCDDGRERAEKVLAGEVDLTFQVPSEYFEQVEATPNLLLRRIPGPDTPVISLNGHRAPYSENRVRRAVHMAIDRDALIREALGGVGLIPRSILSPNVFGYDNSLPELQPRIDEARHLLQAAGHESGFDTDLVVPGDAVPKGAAVAKMVREQLAEIGLRVRVLELTEDDAWPRMQSGAFDMFLNGWSELTLDADYNLYANYHSVSREGCQNPELDRWIEMGRKSLNASKRLEVYKKAQALILDSPYRVPLYHQVDTWVYGADITGFEPRSDRMIDLRRVGTRR